MQVIRLDLRSVAFVNYEKSVLFGGLHLDAIAAFLIVEDVSAFGEYLLSILATDVLSLCISALLEVRHLLLLASIIKH
jgi:hypothetical protein